jgi:hypothetical protein
LPALRFRSPKSCRALLLRGGLPSAFAGISAKNEGACKPPARSARLILGSTW